MPDSETNPAGRLASCRPLGLRFVETGITARTYTPNGGPAVLDVDRSAETVVVVCDCGWRSLTLTLPDAWLTAANHSKIHDDPADRLRALANFRAACCRIRHAPG